MMSITAWGMRGAMATVALAAALGACISQERGAVTQLDTAQPGTDTDTGDSSATQPADTATVRAWSCGDDRCEEDVGESPLLCPIDCCPDEAGGGDRPEGCPAPDPCRDLSCNEAGECTTSIVDGRCVIDGDCVEAGDARAGNPCEVCDPSVDQASWTAVDDDAVACDDDDNCTLTSHCAAGLCAGAPEAECVEIPTCADVQCDEGGCAYVVASGFCLIGGGCYADGESPAGDPCRVCDMAQPRQWTGKTGTPCDDGDGCTERDVCDAGQCVPGAARDCDDGQGCTNESCIDGGCVYEIEFNNCLIDATCHAGGDPHPQLPCFHCAPAASPAAWTALDEGACDDGDVCTSLGTCSDGVCIADPALDEFEPNNSITAAEPLADVGLRDGFPVSSVAASLNPDHDVDWFRFGIVLRIVLATASPQIRVSQLPTDASVDVCLYLRCQDGSTPSGLTCTGAPSADDPGQSLVGCCAASGGDDQVTISLDASCSGLGSEAGDAFAAISGGQSGGRCDGYTLEWGSVDGDR